MDFPDQTRKRRKHGKIVPSHLPFHRAGVSETRVVKMFAAGVRRMYTLGDLLGGSPWSVPHSTWKRIRKRVAKKMRQPFRRKDRGPLRARAAGKNEVRPRP